MKPLIKLCAAGAISSFVLIAAATAGNQTFVTQGPITATKPNYYETWNVSIPAATSIYQEVRITVPSTPGANGGGGGYVPPSSVTVSVGSASPGTVQDTDFGSGPAGNYFVSHAFGGTVGVYGYMKTTFSW